jgi:hypothetical protein
MSTKKRATVNPLPETENGNGENTLIINLSGFDTDNVWNQLKVGYTAMVHGMNVDLAAAYTSKHSNWVQSYIQVGKIMEKAIRMHGPVPVVPTALEPVFVDEPGKRDASYRDTGVPLMAELPIPQRYVPAPDTVHFSIRVPGWTPEAYYATEKSTVDIGTVTSRGGKKYMLKVYGKLGSIFYLKIWELTE